MDYPPARVMTDRVKSQTIGCHSCEGRNPSEREEMDYLDEPGNDEKGKKMDYPYSRVMTEDVS